MESRARTKTKAAKTARKKSLESICRICLTERSPLADIFDPRLDIPSLLTTCSAVKIAKKDGLPSRICFVCAKRATAASAFKRLAEQSDAKLRDHVDGSSTELTADIKDEHLLKDIENLEVLFQPDTGPRLKMENPPYECVICITRFNSSQELKRHIANIHLADNQELDLQCKQCNKACNSQFELEKHQATHPQHTVDGKLNVCPICRQEFIRHKALLTHMGYHSEDSQHKCVECNCYFTSALHLNRHKSVRHEKLPSANRKKRDAIVNDDACEELEVNIEPNPETFSSDIKSEPSDVPSDMDNIDEDDSSLNEDLQNESDSGKNRINRNKQLRLSLKRKSKSIFQAKLKKTLKIENKNFSKDSVQDDNDPDFSEASIVTKKSKERSNLCPICGKGYAKPASLAKHLVTHKDKAQRPMLECPICGKVVNHTNHLLVHMRAHKDENGQSIAPKIEDPDKALILCTMCGKSCSSKSNLAVHMRRHLGVMTCICKICGKGYPRTTDLTLHMRQHTGERPFICHRCDKGFARSDKLAIHMRIHTGEKPYSCKICSRAFAQSNDLAAHKKRNNCQNPHSVTKTNLTIPSKHIYRSQNRRMEVLSDHSMYTKNNKRPANASWGPGKSKLLMEDQVNSSDSTASNMDNDEQHILVVSASNSSNNRVMELINTEGMSAKAISELMKQNLTMPELLATQRALELVSNANHSNRLPSHQRGDFTDYTASLLQSISNGQTSQFNMR